MINPDQILIFEYSLGAHTVVDADVLQTVSTIPVTHMFSKTDLKSQPIM